jgi:hypothetical protein
MKLLGIVVPLVLSLAACAPGDTWSSRVQDPGLPPLAPEHLLRKPADFRLYEASVRKEFFLYFYEDADVKEELVVVIDQTSSDSRPRFATLEEHDFALDLFQTEWKARNDVQKLRYFNERYAAERKRRLSLLDDRIHFKQGEVKLLEDKENDLDADLKSRKATGAYAGGDEKFSLAPAAALEAEHARTVRALAVAQAELFVLEHLRSMRDLASARGSGEFTEGRIRADDLAADREAGDKLVQEVMKRVAPGAWGDFRPEARLRWSGGELVVWQTRDVILQVRNYIDRRRAEERARLVGEPRF